MNKKLYRNEYHKVLGGVCSGLADYFEMDVTIMRLLFAFTFFIMGVGFGTYIILWIVLPRRGFMYNNYNNPVVDYTAPPKQPTDQFTTAGQKSAYGDNPFGSNPWGTNAASDANYANNPFGGNPIPNIPPKEKSHAGLIAGIVLIFVGGAILIDNYDLIPDFDFGRLWPLILVIVGGALMVSGQKREPWHKADWNEPDKKENPVAEDPAPATDDNAPTV